MKKKKKEVEIAMLNMQTRGPAGCGCANDSVVWNTLSPNQPRIEQNTMSNNQLMEVSIPFLSEAKFRTYCD